MQHYILYLFPARSGVYLCEIVSEVRTVLGVGRYQGKCSLQVPEKIGFMYHKLAVHCHTGTGSAIELLNSTSHSQNSGTSQY